VLAECQTCGCEWVADQFPDGCPICGGVLQRTAPASQAGTAARPIPYLWPVLAFLLAIGALVLAVCLLGP
jgi:hypothetical protein